MADDPLTGGRYAEPSVLILTSLADGPKHGYALIQDIESFSGVVLGAGTLYGALARLESRRLIRALAPEDRRRPYAITKAGASALSEHVAVLAKIARTGRRRLATT